MLQATQQHIESSTPTTPSPFPAIERHVTSVQKTSTDNPPICRIESKVVFSPLPAGYREIGDVIAKYEKDPRKAKLLANARRELSAALGQEKTLSALRLQKGMSQAKLAEAIGTSQSRLSRIECGLDDILLSTFEKLVIALDVSRDQLAIALNNTKQND